MKWVILIVVFIIVSTVYSACVAADHEDRRSGMK